MMCRIYLADRELVITSNRDDEPGGMVILQAEAGFDQTKLVQNLQNNKSTRLISEHPDEILALVKKSFRVIEAGGGLVSNRDGAILMIFRHNRWDLPKGKLELGETVASCAVREVSEECGLTGLRILRALPDTFHLYEMEGQWVLKQIHWFRMDYSGSEFPVPQLEEDITQAAWIAPGKLDLHLQTSYRTIRDVFESAGFFV